MRKNTDLSAVMEIFTDMAVPSCVVVTFVFRDLTPKEQLFMKQNATVLRNHPFVVVHPESYPVDYLLETYPWISDITVEDKWMSSVMAYNAMMLSPWFYEMFSDYDYMLICQTDAYVFSDQLDDWCLRGYDYVGAPWLGNDTIYERTLGTVVRPIMKRLVPVRNFRVHSDHLYHEVGNGGFCLRRVSKMIQVMRDNQDIIRQCKGKHERMEDVMICIILGSRECIRRPKWEEALYFSFEKAPRWCLEITGGVYPFGCHDTNARYWESFWKERIM